MFMRYVKVEGYPKTITVHGKGKFTFTGERYKTASDADKRERQVMHAGFITVVSKHNCDKDGWPEAYGIYRKRKIIAKTTKK